MRVAVIVYPGFEELDVVGPYDVLRTAAVAGADVDTLLVTRDRAGHVTGANGLTVEPQGTLDDGPFDLVIVPGGGWNARSAAGAHAPRARRGAPRGAGGPAPGGGG